MADTRQMQQWEILLETGRNEAALATVGAQLAGEPDDPAALRYLARTLIALSRPIEAEDAARHSLASQPDDEWGLRLLAVALGLQAKDAEAVIVAQHAVRSAPSSPRVWAAAADRLIAARTSTAPHKRPALHRMRIAFRPLAAVGLAKHAVALDPHDAGSMIALSRAYVCLADRQRAMAVLGLVLRAEPDHGDAQRRLAALDRRGGRWVALAMTADLLADEESRAALRASSIQDLSDLAGELRTDELQPLRIDRRGRVDDRGVVDAMAVGGDGDVGRWLGLQIRIRFCLAGIVQAVVGLAGGTNRVAAAIVLAALAISTAGIAFPWRRGHNRAWRSIARTQLRSPWSVTMLLLNLASGVGAVLAITGRSSSGLAAAGAFGIICELVLLMSMTNRDLAAYRILVPSGNTFIAAFRAARAVATAGLLTGYGAAIVTVVGQGDSGSTGLGIRLAYVVGAAAVVVTTVVLTRRRDAAVRQATTLLAKTQMRWALRWAAFVWIVGLTVAIADVPAAAFVGIGAFVVGYEVILLWVVGELRYLPGMGAATRNAAIAQTARRTSPRRIR